MYSSLGVKIPEYMSLLRVLLESGSSCFFVCTYAGKPYSKIHWTAIYKNWTVKRPHPRSVYEEICSHYELIPIADYSLSSLGIHRAEPSPKSLGVHEHYMAWYGSVLCPAIAFIVWCAFSNWGGGGGGWSKPWIRAAVLSKNHSIHSIFTP